MRPALAAVLVCRPQPVTAVPGLANKALLQLDKTAHQLPVLRCCQGSGPIGREPLLNLRDRSHGRGFSGLNQFTAPRKAIPFDGSDVRRYNQIGLVAPAVFGRALKNLEATVN